MNSPSIQRKSHFQPELQRLDKTVCSTEYTPLSLVAIMGTKMKTTKDLQFDISTPNPKQTKKLFHPENHHSSPQVSTCSVF